MTCHRFRTILAALVLLVGTLGQRSSAQCVSNSNIYRFTYANVRYEIVKEAKTWADAAACAVQRGGYLAQIDSAAEQAAIYSAIQAAGVSPNYNPIEFGGGASYVWIGGTDRVSEGSWVWDGNDDGLGTPFWQGSANGTAVAGRYNNWGRNAQGARQEPDNFLDAQDCVAIGLSKWPVGAPLQLGAAGQWNDISEDSSCFFVIENAPPVASGLAVSSVTPSYGALVGGQEVSVLGNGFNPDDTSISFGGRPGAVMSVSADGTFLTAITPAAPAGQVSVTVTTPTGSASKANAFRYMPRPAVLAVTPPAGPTTGGTVITVTGTNFVAGSTGVFVNGVPGTVTSVNASGTSMQAITPAGVAGLRAVTVRTNAGEGAAPNGFNYREQPTVDSISPSDGPLFGGTTVTIDGSGFVPGQTTVKFGSASATNVTVLTPTLLTARTGASTAGEKRVTVTTAGGTGVLDPALQVFTYRPRPVVAAVAPPTGSSAGGTTITITGSGFVPGSTVVKVGAAPASAVVVGDGGTTLTAVTGASSIGLKPVSVITSGGSGSKANAFTYLPVPTITGLARQDGGGASGSVTGGYVVILTGTNFVSGATVVKFGGRNCALLSVTLGGTRLTATVPPGSPGPVDVTVTTFGGTGTLPGGFTYTIPFTLLAPTASAGPRSPAPGLHASGAGDASSNGTFVLPMVPAWAPDTGIAAVDEFIVAATTAATGPAPCGDSVPEVDLDGNGEPDLCQLRRGDLDLDGDRDGWDMRLMMELLGRESPDGIADVDGDGVVTLLDVLRAMADDADAAMAGAPEDGGA